MNNGFIKVAAVTPKLKVADCKYNSEKIIEEVTKLSHMGVNLAVFPELCITSYTCGDLFLQSNLLKTSKEEVINILNATKDLDIVFIIGLPYVVNNNLYNTAFVIYKGEVLGIVPKTYLPTYNEFYEARHFVKAPKDVLWIEFNDKKVPFGSKILFTCSKKKEFSFAVEICEDLWAPIPVSSYHALNGATIIVNLSASNEIIGKADYRRTLIESQSARLNCGYIYADAGCDESTTDMVFSGHNIIAENGSILEESKLFSNDYIISEIDVDKLLYERRRITSFLSCDKNEYEEVFFELEKKPTKLSRKFSMYPFVPEGDENIKKRCNEILDIQTYGLIKRINHINAKKIVVGISGGLDSSLALLVMVRAIKILNRPLTDIIAVTMPCFGTSKRTKNNAVFLSNYLGVTLKEVDITEAVKVHFRDIDHKDDVYDVTYENAQARERTQVLMDIANQCGGIVIGTGDLSEVALGWSTYNGDHMSMYAVNNSVPKTLIKYIVNYFVNFEIESDEVKKILKDILDTPISPELLPGDKIQQKTEEIVGPYALNDFFLFYAIRYAFCPSKIYFLAKNAFNGIYSDEEIKSRLKDFYRRFFNNQFKRSCIPDGPKVGTVSLSPRGDWRMPSDASYNMWLYDIE